MSASRRYPETRKYLLNRLTRSGPRTSWVVSVSAENPAGACPIWFELLTGWKQGASRGCVVQMHRSSQSPKEAEKKGGGDKEK